MGRLMNDGSNKMSNLKKCFRVQEDYFKILYELIFNSFIFPSESDFLEVLGLTQGEIPYKMHLTDLRKIAHDIWENYKNRENSKS